MNTAEDLQVSRKIHDNREASINFYFNFLFIYFANEASIFSVEMDNVLTIQDQEMTRISASITCCLLLLLDPYDIHQDKAKGLMEYTVNHESHT